MPLPAGTRIGAYAIGVPLGAGGMGEVYRARDPTLNRDVALKILRGLSADDSDRLARLTREAQTRAALNHPNIAQVHGLEAHEGGRAIVMELVEDRDLARSTVARIIVLAGSRWFASDPKARVPRASFATRAFLWHERRAPSSTQSG
jgi:serine/threonine protein kinase